MSLQHCNHRNTHVFVMGLFTHKRVNFIHFLVAFETYRKATISIVILVRLSVWNKSSPIRWLFMKYDVYGFFEIRRQNYNLIKI